METEEKKAQAPRFTAQEILDMLAQHREELRRLGVRSIGLFGSYRKGEATGESDMDFLVTLERHTFDDYMNLKFLLEDLFGCDVDVVIEENIKPRLRPYIMADVIYAQGL